MLGNVVLDKKNGIIVKDMSAAKLEKENNLNETSQNEFSKGPRISTLGRRPTSQGSAASTKRIYSEGGQWEAAERAAEGLGKPAALREAGQEESGQVRFIVMSYFVVDLDGLYG